MRAVQLRQEKPKRIIILLGIVFFALLVLGGIMISQHQYKPVDADDKTTIAVSIPAGSGAVQVAGLLKAKDLIRSEKAFLKYCRQEQLDGALKAGSFSLSRSMSTPEICRQLVDGKNANNYVTIPEGYTLKTIGQLMLEKRHISEEAWQKALQDDYDYDFLPAPGSPNRLEGYLYPDTYEFAEQADAHDIIDQMLSNFAFHWDQEFAQLAKKQNLNQHDVVIIASLVEGEAQQADERRRIAGVIYNRLAIDMPLQIDATVLYSLGTHKNTVDYNDLKVDSPYNTYLHRGLPAGPIGSPGSAAIKAAMQPEKNDYYYYVSRGDGSHQFSRTYSEHLAAIKKYAQ
ncbi:MAG TPA: endolytic transglycosylase MltG [Syntrophomonas sp.]|nr:endolytic transglycosylase MltG [Syntrophomonas sp.]